MSHHLADLVNARRLRAKELYDDAIARLTALEASDESDLDAAEDVAQASWERWLAFLADVDGATKGLSQPWIYGADLSTLVARGALALEDLQEALACDPRRNTEGLRAARERVANAEVGMRQAKSRDGAE